MKDVLDNIRKSAARKEKMLAVLIDPEKFEPSRMSDFLSNLPNSTTHLLVGGSTGGKNKTLQVIKKLKGESRLPVILFPGDYSQITGQEDALFFLSLISGRNPEYLIGQQIKAVPALRNLDVEVIPTAYLLIDGGNISAVQRVSETDPLSQNDSETIVQTALAGELSGKQLVYLEAGSGAKIPVAPGIISEVKKALQVPLIIGGGIRSEKSLLEAWKAGADMVVVGTAFEEGNFLVTPDSL